MSESLKILIVVEGEKREKPFLQKLMQLYGLNAKLYVFHTNIYNLYLAMEQIDFNGDLRDVLISLPCMQGQDLDILRHTNFTYTYLIFDCDAQHTMDKNLDKTIYETMTENFLRLEKMVKYFTDETDPSVGKLYVNYPMMESYRHCDDFFDNSYRNTQICIHDISSYKQITGHSKLANHRVDTFTRENFASLLRMNIYKLNAMLGSGWECPSYQTFQMLSEQAKIAVHQKEAVASTHYMDVLNTTLFLLADYYGNRNGFYDDIVAEKESQTQGVKDEYALPT